MSSQPRYLLLLACSQRKRLDEWLLPALERYDGGNYRILRKAQREGRLSPSLDIVILSAKYGLIESDTLIAHYEQRMTQERAKELYEQVMQTLQKLVEQETYREVYVELGQQYLQAISDVSVLFQDSSVIYAHGRIGERLARLKLWITTIQRREYEAISCSV